MPSYDKKKAKKVKESFKKEPGVLDTLWGMAKKNISDRKKKLHGKKV